LTSSTKRATASPTSQTPVGPAMTSNGKAYEIDDCFLYTTRPGTWETDGPAMANRPCTWSQRSDLTGDLSSIIDTGVVKSGQRERVALKLGE
jgi:hypothetical protein